MSDPNKSWPDAPAWHCTDCSYTCRSQTYREGHEQISHHHMIWALPR